MSSTGCSLQNLFGPLWFIWYCLVQSCFNHISFIPNFVFCTAQSLALMMVLHFKNKWKWSVVELVRLQVQLPNVLKWLLWSLNGVAAKKHVYISSPKPQRFQSEGMSSSDSDENSRMLSGHCIKFPHCITISTKQNNLRH